MIKLERGEDIVYEGRGEGRKMWEERKKRKGKLSVPTVEMKGKRNWKGELGKGKKK